MESLVLASAFLGISIGTSLCCFWMACHGSTLKDVFLGVASAAILLAGALGSVTAHAWRKTVGGFQKPAQKLTQMPAQKLTQMLSQKKHLYSAISKAKHLDSIPESVMESLPYV